MKTGQYSVEDQIDAVTVSSTMMQPMEIYRLAPRVVKIFLPVLGVQSVLRQTVGKLSGAKTDRDQLLKLFMMIDVAQFMPVLGEILAALSLPENAKLPQELLSRTQLHVRDDEGQLCIKQLGTEAEINDAFRGKFMRMLKVMWFAAAFNFADFFPGGSPSGPINSSEPPMVNH
jgi:hypothetical protein